MGILSDGSSIIITNMRVKSCDEHERVVHDFINVVAVGLDTSNAVKVEGFTGISQKQNGVEYITDNKWLEDIKLEVAHGATDSNSHMVSHNLSAAHGHGFTLSWVDLTRHDG